MKKAFILSGNWRFILPLLVMIAITFGGIASTFFLLRNEAIATHKQIADLHARTFEENFAQIMETLDHTMERIPLLSNQHVDPKLLTEIFSEFLDNSPYVRSFSLLDESGTIHVSSYVPNINQKIDIQNFLPVPFIDMPLLRIGVPHAGRDFFSAHASTPSKPIAPKSLSFIPVMKKVSFGRKPYYLMATLNTDYFANRYTHSLPLNEGSVSLWRIDGILLFSTDTHLALGSSFFNLTQPSTENTFFENLQRSSVSLIGAQRLARTAPFIVDITMNQDIALQYWKEERNKMLWISTLLISLCGVLGFTLFLRNYKEVERQQKQLNYEKQFRLAMEATQTGLWTWNYQTDTITWDTQCFSLLDYAPDAFVPSLDKIQELTHQEDMLFSIFSLKEQLKSNPTYIVERRMKTSANAWRWIQIRGKVTEFSSDGEPLFITGVYINIDAQKQAEQLHLAAVAFDTQDAIIITDAHTKIVKVNQAFTKITGYDSTEVLGKTPNILKSGIHDKAFYALMWKALNEEGFWQGEIWNKRKNGDVYAEYTTITSIKDDDNVTTHYLANFSDITTQKVSQKQIEDLAYRDPLTHLGNRHLFDETLLKVLLHVNHNHHFGALIFLDLDYFKELNDTHGHDAGDMLLVQVGKRLRDCTRENDTVARLGGDEFVILLENVGTNEKQASEQSNIVASKILIHLNKPFSLAYGNYSVSASIGITIFSDTTKNSEELLKEADQAMYEAKKKGRNQICSYSNLKDA